MQCMAKNDATTRKFDIQVGQIASALNSRQQGNLPSDTITNPQRKGKEECKAITLRSGKELPEISNSSASNDELSKEDEVVLE